MESTYVPKAEEQELTPAEAPAPPVPSLIFLESAEDAGVCDVDGVCN
ncbi:hypothetical protein [Actinoplanes sp. HUAS TT8]